MLKPWTGFGFLEMVLTFSTLLAPGLVEVDSAYTRGPEVKSPRNDQCEHLHLLHHVSWGRPVLALAWLFIELGAAKHWC